jgi:hypothetical protein
MAEQERSYWDLLEPHWSQLGDYDSAADWLRIKDAFPQPIILLYAAHFSQSEICNGGLLQFFRNGSGVFGPEAIEGFRVIGMPIIADVVHQAASILGIEYPRDRQQRWDALQNASKRTPEDLEVIRKNFVHPASVERQASQPPTFDGLDSQFFKLIYEEAGGFESAADAYALSVEPTLVWPTPSSDSPSE